MTIIELKEKCEELINKGYDDKTILVSNNESDEGVHYLCNGFVTHTDDKDAFENLIDSNAGWIKDEFNYPENEIALLL